MAGAKSTSRLLAFHITTSQAVLCFETRDCLPHVNAKQRTNPQCRDTKLYVPEACNSVDATNKREAVYYND